MGMSNYVHVHVEKIVRETEAAFLLSIDGEEHWVPKSQLSDPEDYEVGDEDLTISMTAWIVKEKGFDWEN